MKKALTSNRRQKSGEETAVRERILEAAFAAFMKSGYATASTLEIATRARVSKRELYALVGNKQEMLIACISERAKRLDGPADLPVLRDRETLEQVLSSFGTKFVREVSDPTVIAVFLIASCFWRVRLVVRTQPSQGWYTGSTPVRAATYETAFLIGKIAKKWSDESHAMKC